MHSFPITVRVDASEGNITHETEPRIAINPVEPSEHPVDAQSSTPVIQQVINAIDIKVDYFKLSRLIFDLRSIRDVMRVLGLSIIGVAHSNYTLVERVSTDDERDMVPLLCALVTEIFGVVLGDKQRKLLTPPPKPEKTILAYGPTTTYYGCHKRRVVIVPWEGGGYRVEDQLPDEETFIISERFVDFLPAINRFVYRVQEQVFKDCHFGKHQAETGILACGPTISGQYLNAAADSYQEQIVLMTKPDNWQYYVIKKRQLSNQLLPWFCESESYPNFIMAVSSFAHRVQEQVLKDYLANRPR